MTDDEIGTKPYQPWHPMTNPQDVKTLGKLAEELGECAAATARCLIQGIDEVEPMTKVPNRELLEDEIADVMVNTSLVITRFGLNESRILDRAAKKLPLIMAWHEEA